MKIALSILLIVAGLASGCAKAPPSGPPPKNNGSNVTSSTLNVSTNQSTGTDNSRAANISPNATNPAAAGADFVNNTLASFLPSSGWTPPLPPTGGQKPRALTQQEKDRLLQIANSFRAVVDMKNNPDVVGIYSNFLWVEWIGHADGEGFLNYVPVEKGTVNVSNKSANWFPAADFIFQSRFSRLSAVGIHVAVNLETGKVVWSGGYVTVLPETVSKANKPNEPKDV